MSPCNPYHQWFIPVSTGLLLDHMCQPGGGGMFFSLSLSFCSFFTQWKSVHDGQSQQKNPWIVLNSRVFDVSEAKVQKKQNIFSHLLGPLVNLWHFDDTSSLMWWEIWWRFPEKKAAGSRSSTSGSSHRKCAQITKNLLVFYKYRKSLLTNKAYVFLR